MGQVNSGILGVTYQSRRAEITLEMANFPDWPTLARQLKATFGLEADDEIYLRWGSSPLMFEIGAETPKGMRDLRDSIEITGRRLPNARDTKVLLADMVVLKKPGSAIDRAPPSLAARKKLQAEERKMVNFLVGISSQYTVFSFPDAPIPSFPDVFAQIETELSLETSGQGPDLCLREGDRLIRITKDSVWRMVGWPAVLAPYEGGRVPELSEVTSFELVAASLTLPAYSAASGSS